MRHKKKVTIYYKKKEKKSDGDTPSELGKYWCTCTVSESAVFNIIDE